MNNDPFLMLVEAGVLRCSWFQLEKLRKRLPDGRTRDVVDQALLRIGQAATILEQEADVLGEGGSDDRR